MTSPRRSTRIAEKAAKESTKKPVATTMKSFVTKSAIKSSKKYLSIMDELYNPSQNGFTPLLYFSDSPYRTLCLAVDCNKFILCIEYISSDEEYTNFEELSRYQYEPLQRFSYKELEHICINPLDNYKYTDDTKFLNRFFGVIQDQLPLLKKHIAV